MGAWDYDLVSDVAHFDARAQKMYNLPSDSLDHRPESVVSVVHPDDVSPMFDAIRHASDVNGDGRYDIDYHIAQGDGADEGRRGFLFNFISTGKNNQEYCTPCYTRAN